jgi:three-Cys-motif partner protein
VTDPPIWPIEDHTAAKHALLRRYLGGWFPILTRGGFNRRVIYLDGFAGPGIYDQGEPGSPLIALDTLVHHAAFQALSSTEFLFLFVEERSDRAQLLEDEVQKFWAALPSGQPSNVKVVIYNQSFKDVATDLAYSLREQKKQLAPTFAFVDPFGWSGVPLEVIADLLSFDRCEVLFNFMYDSINRFVADTRPGVARHFADLFGTAEEEHAQAGKLAGEERKEFLRELYIRQLREVADFDYVRSFELVDGDRGRTAYYLMYGTRHPKGLAVMKEAMWSLDPVAGQRFAGSTGGQSVLFGPEPDFEPLRLAIIEEFAGSDVPVEAIEAFVVAHTDYKASHLRRVLKPLEKEEELVECLSDRRKRWTYPAGTVLRFRVSEQAVL